MVRKPNSRMSGGLEVEPPPAAHLSLPLSPSPPEMQSLDFFILSDQVNGAGDLQHSPQAHLLFGGNAFS